MIKSKFKRVLIGINALILMGCGGDTDQAARPISAYNMAGVFKTSSASELKMNFQIVSENKFNDITLFLTRESDVTSAELDFLAKHSIQASFVRDQWEQTLIFGQGVGNYDSYSTDAGKTTRTQVCTQSTKFNDSIEIKYCFSSITGNDSRKMLGQFVIEVTRQEIEIINGKKSTVVRKDSHQTSFDVNLDSAPYREYAGLWSGDVFALVPDLETNIFKKVQLKLLGNGPVDKGQFQTSLLETKEFTYLGDKFIYSEKNNIFSLKEIDEPDYPVIRIIFVGPSNKRIIMSGQLWSLKNFSGAIVYSENGVQQDLGSFRLSRTKL